MATTDGYFRKGEERCRVAHVIVAVFESRSERTFKIVVNDLPYFRKKVGEVTMGDTVVDVSDVMGPTLEVTYTGVNGHLY